MDIYEYFRLVGESAGGLRRKLFSKLSYVLRKTNILSPFASQQAASGGNYFQKNIYVQRKLAFQVQWKEASLVVGGKSSGRRQLQWQEAVLVVEANRKITQFGVGCPDYQPEISVLDTFRGCFQFWSQVELDGVRWSQIELDRVRQRQIELDRVRQSQIELDRAGQSQIELDRVRYSQIGVRQSMIE